MKILSAAALAAYAIHGVFATSHKQAKDKLEDKRDVEATTTTFVTPTPTTIMYTPTPDITVTQTLPTPTVVGIVITSSPKPEAAFYRQERINEPCRASHPAKRCRLLPNNPWWPAGGKECWCMKESMDPGEPARPPADWDAGWEEGLVGVAMVPPPIQGVINQQTVIDYSDGPFWMEAPKPTKGAWEKD